uniref:Telomerase reverse transcriptase n=1 Tax=Oncorhynchus kisutch TaxID=8019 RepID=A0A8C7DCL6_ONCKI
MPSGDMTRVLGILSSLYPHVETLEEFADHTVFREGQRAVLIEPTDTTRFISFVRGVFVCTDKTLQDVPSCNQISTVPELLAFVLNNTKRKKKRNVLAHGYGYTFQDRDADQFKFHGEITQSAAYIHGSDLWKRICQRLGTDVSKYLLESCSLFVTVPPSSAFQVCGVPVYDRVSMSTGISRFHLGYKRNGTTRNSRGRSEVRNGGWEFQRSGGRKRRWDGGRDTGKRKGEEVSLGGKREREEVEGDGSAVVQRPVEEQSGPVSATVHVEGGPSWRTGSFPPLSHSQSFIRTLGMLYGGRGMRRFLLNRKRKSRDEGPRRLQGRDLVRLVFFEGVAYLNGAERKPERLPRRFFTLVPLFCQLLRRHRRCPYSKILQRVCPAVGQGDMASLLPQHSAPHRVYLFVRECLNAVVPSEFWGSDHNRFKFLSAVRNFLSMGKFERMSLAELMWKMKVNDCDWLKISKTGRCPPSELSYRTRVLGQLLAWLLDGYVLGLVRAMFYVTESMGQKNALRFYRYQVWAKLQELALSGHLSKGQMSELTLAQVTSLPKTTVISRLRFIPKTEVYVCVCVCVRSSPSLLGSTVWGLTDIHRVLSSITPAQKDKPQPLYFVKVDVSGAYDSLPHTRLLEVIGQVLSHVQEELFSVRCYAKVWADTHEGLKKTFVRQVQHTHTHTHTPLPVLCQTGTAHTHTHTLTSPLSRNNLSFRQCQGIPQGSVASSLLCCLCYGHMENLLFPNVSQRGGCLMRLVDDFLLITPDLSQAQTFLKTLMAGVPQYGCVVNPQKVAVNFPLGEGGSCPAGVRLLPLHCLFPWCGLLLNTHTLDVHNNYGSYAGLSLRYSLTLGSAHCAGQQMKRKLMSILRFKCHALFLDLKTNSLEAVYSNIYKLVLLHAFRFHACAQSLPFGQKVGGNHSYFLNLIWDLAEYTNQLVRLCNKGLSLGCKALTGSLQYEAVELIYCLAFLLVLSRHRPLYYHLLAPLRTRTYPPYSTLLSPFTNIFLKYTRL